MAQRYQRPLQSYEGRVRGMVRRGALELAETTYQAHQHVGRHTHDRPTVVVVLGGSMTEHACGRTVTYRPGCVAFHPAGEPHRHTFGSSPSRCLTLQIGDEWAPRSSFAREVLPPGPAANRSEAVTGAARLLHAEFRQGDAASEAVLDGLLLTILGGLSRREPSPERQQAGFIDRVLSKLHDEIDRDVGLSSLAVLAGVSPEHLARTFRAAKGMTIGEYVRALRVERARRLLAEGDYDLSRIALELGFYDQSHFTRTFKAHVGCTPGQYRRRSRSATG